MRSQKNPELQTSLALVKVSVRDSKVRKKLASMRELVFQFSLLLLWIPRYLNSSTTSSSCPRKDMGRLAVLFLLKLITIALNFSTFRSRWFLQGSLCKIRLDFCIPPPVHHVYIQPVQKYFCRRHNLELYSSLRCTRFFLKCKIYNFFTKMHP